MKVMLTQFSFAQVLELTFGCDLPHQIFDIRLSVMVDPDWFAQSSVNRFPVNEFLPLHFFSGFRVSFHIVSLCLPEILCGLHQGAPYQSRDLK